jgi:hypothetical protein
VSGDFKRYILNITEKALFNLQEINVNVSYLFLCE